MSNNEFEAEKSAEPIQPNFTGAINRIDALGLPKLAETVEVSRPKRCRAIIYSPDGNSVLGIIRKRPDREAYAVYPGGGLEETDETPIDGITRELDEELSLVPDVDYVLTGHYLFEGDEMFFVGYAPNLLDGMQIHGPEAERDTATSGTYEPTWIPLGELTSRRMFPEEVSSVIEDVRT